MDDGKLFFSDVLAAECTYIEIVVRQCMDFIGATLGFIPSQQDMAQTLVIPPSRFQPRALVSTRIVKNNINIQANSCRAPTAHRLRQSAHFSGNAAKVCFVQRNQS